jgi:hypothetical protein
MKHGWLWLVIPWVVFLAAAGGWVTYWFAAASTAEARLNEWVDAQQARGAEARVGRIVRHGFPMLLRLELQDAAYAPPREGWRLSTARADLHVDLLNPAHVILQAQAPIAFARANGAVSNISADALIVSIRSQGEAVAQAGVEANALVIDDPAAEGLFTARRLVANWRPDPRTPDSYQFALDAEGVTLPRPVRSFESFGQDIASLRVAVVVDQAAMVLNSESGDPLAPWRDAGGQLRFEALALTWGPLSTTGAGEVRLDEQRRLAGALHFPIEEPGPIFRALASDPRMEGDAARGLELLATAFALSGDDITLDVEAGDGVLRLEGVRVRSLPPVY